MPPLPTGQPYKLEGERSKGLWGIRYRDALGVRKRQSPFRSSSAATRWYRENIEPTLRGDPAVPPDLTLRDFADNYVKWYGARKRTKSGKALSERIAYATAAFGDVPLRDLQRMVSEIAAWDATQGEEAPRSRYARMGALRQTLDAAVAWGYMESNPAKAVGKNPQPDARPIRVYTPAELDALTDEMPSAHRGVPHFVAATGLRPEEWAPLERSDIDRRARVATIRRTVSDGEVVPLAKTKRSRREVPLSRRALEALDASPPRLDTPLLFPGVRGGVLNLDNWRRRVWGPAVEAAGIATPARLYDLRSTFASNALAGHPDARLGLFELARIMGTSPAMIERHYGTLLDGAMTSLADRLDALDAARARAAEDDAEGSGH